MAVFFEKNTTTPTPPKIEIYLKYISSVCHQKYINIFFLLQNLDNIY